MAREKAKKVIQSIADLTPDPANVNKGTERGHHQLDWSLTELGAGRSILADAQEQAARRQCWWTQSEPLVIPRERYARV